MKIESVKEIAVPAITSKVELGGGPLVARPYVVLQSMFDQHHFTIEIPGREKLLTFCTFQANSRFDSFMEQNNLKILKLHAQESRTPMNQIVDFLFSCKQHFQSLNN